jgi:hypothetical protein
MNEDVRRLLGGYATGSLTEAERKQLYEAALGDPQLFEALADEHSLRELLDDPAARAEILRATESPRFSVRALLTEWLARPTGKVLGSLLALLVVAVCVQTIMDTRRPLPREEAEPKLVAQAPTRPSEQPPTERTQAEPAAVPPAPARETSRAARPRSQPEVPAPSVRGTAPPQPAPVAELGAKRPQQEQSLTQTVVAGDLRLQYMVLLQRPGETPVPVARDHVFEPGDQVQLRFESPQPGWLVLRGELAGVGPTVTPIEPDKPVLYTVAQNRRMVEVIFSREAPAAAGVRALRTQSDTVRTLKVPESTSGTSVTTMPSTPPNALALRIVLDRKKD